MKKNIKAVGVVFEDKDGNILVLRRHSASREGDKWGLVGGNIDDGENSIQAAIRETSEEINHKISKLDLEFVKSYQWEHDDADISFDVFMYKIDQDKGVIKLDTNENTEHLWARPETLYVRDDLMKGLYPILKDSYKV